MGMYSWEKGNPSLVTEGTSSEVDGGMNLCECDQTPGIKLSIGGCMAKA